MKGEMNLLLDPPIVFVNLFILFLLGLRAIPVPLLVIEGHVQGFKSLCFIRVDLDIIKHDEPVVVAERRPRRYLCIFAELVHLAVMDDVRHLAVVEVGGDAISCLLALTKFPRLEVLALALGAGPGSEENDAHFRL